MNPIVKKTISVVIVVILIVTAYFGNFMPLSKSAGFIEAMKSLGPTASLDDFEKNFAKVLGIPSPIGQEELVRQLASLTLNILQQNNDPQTISKLVSIIETNYAPIVNRDRGMSFSQDLYILGSINELAFLKTKQPAYFVAAKKYFEKGLEFGPRRPQSLYGAFDIFRLEGNVAETTRIANTILEQWPTDQKTKDLLAEFLAQVQKSQKK